MSAVVALVQRHWQGLFMFALVGFFVGGACIRAWRDTE